MIQICVSKQNAVTVFCCMCVSNHNQDLSCAPDQPTESQNVIVVGFYLGDEAIPYRTTIQGDSVTLGQFKQLISKRGSYR